ncbi:hypothetical protein EOE67_02870 [Rheinheimera riviphila]|uniref:YchJ-like middle NTF2-like domain-containing protein n=1 Tax=Rheinheimera riviphila TaxID=1834037 RepID=A0A437R319_9GAMM|nr:YchJ family metal-binding protein [Rheinheimera riviphila]RVU41161.1 hypothetical protein EOE67_02870 [Rheinheimera riviphila]
MNCYCQSGRNFNDCCQPFIQGQQLPGTAEQLMRSRFSAYCDGSDVATQYVANSYHPLSQADNPVAEITAFAKAAHFIGLQVIDVSDELSLPESLQQRLPEFAAGSPLSFSTVHFKVQFIMQDKLHLLEENSLFIRTDLQWSYLDGTLWDHPTQKLSRNDSCPCHSGKKYKNCRPHRAAGQPV